MAEVIRPAATPEVDHKTAAAEAKNFVLLKAPEGVTAVVENGVMYQVYDGVVRVPKELEKELREKQKFTDVPKTAEPAKAVPPAQA